MTLPRFTSGRVGNLDYSHLNEAFDMLDGKSAERVDRRQPRAQPLLAKLLDRNQSGLFSWSEMVRNDDGTYQAATNGLSSTKMGDAYRFPAVSLSGGAMVGDVVIIEPRRTKQGKLYYTIQAGAGTITRAFIIVSSVPHATRTDAWAYIGKTVESVFSPGFGQQWSTTSQLEFVLLNGCENASDGSSIGVGTVPPTGVVSTRRPIKPGTVVTASNINGDWIFSVPNGYQFVCT